VPYSANTGVNTNKVDASAQQQSLIDDLIPDDVESRNKRYAIMGTKLASEVILQPVAIPTRIPHSRILLEMRASVAQINSDIPQV